MALKGKRIALVGGARPNFMKVTPLYRELKKRGTDVTLINAGQHKDDAMSAAFFKEFRIRPSVSLQPKGDTTEEQLQDMRQGLMDVFSRIRPELVIVVGDVNASLIAARAADALHIPVAHVEAGLRSYNPVMQEEHNRIEIDALSRYLFASEKSGIANIRRERLGGKAYLVGNIMMDMPLLYPPKRSHAPKGAFYFCTMHRAENVDNKAIFENVLNALEVIAGYAPLYLPIHPRTEKMAREFGLWERLCTVVRVIPPLSYRKALAHEKFAKLVLTDSGGIQDETSYFRVPCITLRTETERPITVEKGTNVIGGVTKESILRAYRAKRKKGRRIPLWDGKTAGRIADILAREL